MKQDCLEIGTIQAFMDGELDAPMRARVSGHIAICDACAGMLAEAEDEAALVFPVLERELNSLVPTQRLWNRINVAIANEKLQASWWQKLLGGISAAIANPSFAVAAGLLIVIGVFASLWLNRGPESSGSTVATTGPSQPPATRPASTLTTADTPPAALRPTAVQTSLDPSTRPIRAERAIYVTPAAPTNLGNGYMPAEESYVKTIASLARNVEQKKDDILPPSQRVAFERDMAVVNDAISRVKQAARRNPKNETVRQALYSAYQNKIDLLNSVTQKEALMASIR